MSVVALCALALAQPLPQAQPFPFTIAEDRGAAGFELIPRPDLLSSLDGALRVQFDDVPLPGGEPVSLQLERAEAWTPDGLLWVDGEPVGALADLGTTLWTGRVAGEPGSAAFLALSPHGSRGWIDARGQRFHLLAGAGEDGSWSTPRAQLVPDGWILAQGHEPGRACASDATLQPNAPELPLAQSSQALGVDVGAGTLAATVALETDYQFYELFGDTGAASAYALALLGAVSTRYHEEINVVLNVNYLSIYSAESDPWLSQDQGGDCIEVLNEFQAQWWVDAPVHANLYQLLSGADLGCGVAYLWGLCNEDYKYSVSGSLSGLLEFPVVQGPLTWDFKVVAHEFGHLFGAPHTHDWCPPVDQCAPEWAGFGYCQSEQVCLKDTGTVMSYCHLCAGGFENITLNFHPLSRRVMRRQASSSCLVPAAATALGGGEQATPKPSASRR